MDRISATASAVLALTLLTLGCSEPKVSTSDDAKSEPARADPGTTASVASTAAPAAACTSDADCRTWSSYCQEAPCACRVLGKSEAEPACAGAPVSCFADPCMKKAAACQSGRCELVTAETR